MIREGVATRPLPGALLGLLSLTLACVEAPPEASLRTSPDSLDAEQADVAPARYLTHFLFAGLDGSAFYGTFAQQTSAQSLVREYDAWRADDSGWRELASIRDSLPTPRAAWRILPGPGLDVRVGGVREVVGLGFEGPDGPVELSAGEEVAVWTGPTGQRESVGLAALEAGGTPVGGLLFFRRSARALQFPAAATGSRGYLLADSLGNGLLFEVEEDTGAAVARAWLHGSVDAWDDIVFVADSTVSGAVAPRWRFEIPLAALSGTIRAIASPAARPVPAFRIECDLVADGDTFRFTGVAARLELP
ncbi:MAG: hypothetical protein R3195_08750 [Gemmatimonadota bacterium]|nr:hypothetical protein [Gemmatimonadota bacterium]